MFSHTPSPQQAWAVRSTNERPLKHLWHFRISGTYTTSVINTRIVWISSTSHSLFLTRNIEYWLLSVACHQPRSHRWVLPVILAQSLNTSTTNFLLYPEFPPILPFSLLLSPHHLLIYSTCHLFFFFLRKDHIRYFRLYNSGWSWTCNLLASASLVLYCRPVPQLLPQ